MKKNICFFVGDISKVGGIERVGTTLANEIAKQQSNYNVTIVSISKINEDIFFELNDNIKVHYFYDRPARYKKDYFDIVSRFRKLIKKEKFDIIVDVDTMLDLFTLPARFMLGTKVISWEQFNYGENMGIKLMDISRKLAAKYSDYIVVLTKGDKEEFEKNLNIKCPINCIYNPVKVNQTNNNYNLNSKTILSIGRLTHQKGFDILADVAKKVLDQNPDWNWIILGEGEDRQLIQDKIDNHNLQDKVKLLGNVPHVERYYDDSSIFVLTSRYEGLGLVLLEAKSHKLPIVSFDCKYGPAEIVQNEENGYLIDCFNIDEMANKINLLINNPKLRAGFSKLSHKTMERFDGEIVAKQWEQIFEYLTKN